MTIGTGRIREFEIGMPISAVIKKLGARVAQSRSYGRHRLTSPHQVVHRTEDSQCLIYSDLKIGLVVMIALVGEANDVTSSGIHIGTTLREAQLLDDTLSLDEESDLYTSLRDTGVFFELEDREPYIKDDFSDHTIARIEVTNRNLLDEISLAELDVQRLEGIRQKYLVL